MERRTLNGMAAFIRRACDQLAAATPTAADEIKPPTPQPTAEPQSLLEGDFAPQPWPTAQEPAADLPIHAQRGAGEDEGAGAEADWELAQQALDTGAIQEATVVGWNRGGLLVHWHSLQGFLPASQLLRMIRYTTDAERDAAFAGRVGEALRLRAIEVDHSRKRLVFSERALQWGTGNGQCLWEELLPGRICRGRVRNLCDFGAFVDLGGIDGLIHISELAWRHVRHPADMLQIGQEVDVFVMSVEPERKRVALSLKKLCQDPWERIDERYRVGQVVQGTISNVLSFGAFVHVEDGIEGLIHISELAEGTSLHPPNVVAEGDAVKVRIISIDSASRRLALSLRQVVAVESNPAEGSAPASE